MNEKLEEKYSGLLNRAQNHYLLSLFAFPYIRSYEKNEKFQDMEIELIEQTCRVGKLRLSKEQIEEIYNCLLSSEEKKFRSTGQFLDESLAWFFIRSWEYLIEYYRKKFNCDTKKEAREKLKESNFAWFWYANTVRNTLTHDRKIEFPPKKIYPGDIIEWNNKKILRKDNGKELSREVFDHGDANRFHKEIKDIISSYME